MGSSRCRWEGVVWRDALELLWERDWEMAERKRRGEGHGPEMGRIVIEGEHRMKTQSI